MAYSANTTSDVRRSAEQAARQAGNDLADKASELANKASRSLDGAIETAQDTVRQVADGGRDASQRVNEVAGHFKGALDKSVREQPITTLAVAAAVGFVIGALWKS